MSSIFGLFSTSIPWLDGLIVSLTIFYLASRPSLGIHIVLSCISLWLFYETCKSSLSVQLPIDKKLQKEISDEEKRARSYIKNIPSLDPLNQIDTINALNNMIKTIIINKKDLIDIKQGLDSLNFFKKKSQINLIVSINNNEPTYQSLNSFLSQIKFNNTTSLIHACQVLDYNLLLLSRYREIQEFSQQDSVKNTYVAEAANFIVSTIGIPKLKNDLTQHLILILVYLYGTLLALFLYLYERYYRESNKPQVFEGAELFNRYGRQIFSLIVPLGLNDRTEQNIIAVNEKLLDDIFNNLKESYQNISGYNQEVIYIQDHKKKNDGRFFFKIRLKTQRNSTLYYFLYTQPVGEQILIHHNAFVQGHHSWYHALSFILYAPVTVWFWIYKYFKGSYRILNRLNTRFDGSAYDAIDLKSYFQSISFNLMISIRKFAKANNLLTEDLNNLITNTINNTQNIKVSKSTQLKIGNISFGNDNQM